MATFSTVLWQADDELTSEKLNQMAQNEIYLNQFTIQAFRVNNSATQAQNSAPLSSNLNGRTPGTSQVTKQVAVYATFNYTGTQGGVGQYLPSTTTQVSAWVQFPNIFTQAPIVTATIANGPFVCWIADDRFPNNVFLNIQYRDGRQVADWHGTIHLHAMGI